MLLLKVVGMLLKYELNELAITSGSLIMMPFSLIQVNWKGKMNWKGKALLIIICFSLIVIVYRGKKNISIILFVPFSLYISEKYY